MMDRPRWWLILVAAAMAAIFVYQSIGRTGTLVLCAGVMIACAGYRFRRAKNSPKASTVRCLACGETLAATARQCKYCGSASWTVIN